MAFEIGEYREREYGALDSLTEMLPDEGDRLFLRSRYEEKEDISEGQLPNGGNEGIADKDRNLSTAAQRVELAARDSTEAIFKSKTPMFITLTGPMRSGKSTAAKRMAEIFHQHDRRTAFYQCFPNTEKPEPTEIRVRNQEGIPATRIGNINWITNNIRKGVHTDGDIVFVNELQFAVGDDNLSDLIALARTAEQYGVHIVIDGLGIWFNGKKVNAIDLALKLSHRSYMFNSVDFIPSSFLIMPSKL